MIADLVSLAIGASHVMVALLVLIVTYAFSMGVVSALLQPFRCAADPGSDSDSEDIVLPLEEDLFGPPSPDGHDDGSDDDSAVGEDIPPIPIPGFPGNDCEHQRTTHLGSNQFFVRLSCRNCGFILFRDRR
jgi:hypothetical protein